MATKKGNRDDTELIFKMLIIGDLGIGKTALLVRYTKIKRMEMEGERIRLIMWDTAGQERFMIIPPSRFRGTHGVVIAFDLTDMKSFENVRRWLIEIDKHSSSHVVKLLVGNKADLKDKRVVSYKSAQELADQLGISYLETSAKTATNVEQAFTTMITEIKKRVDSGLLDCTNTKPVYISENNAETPWHWKWCGC